MKKSSPILYVSLCLSILLSFNVSTAMAEVAPTCSISFTPQTVKVGESSTETFTYTGVITDTKERSMDQDFPVGKWSKSYAVSISKGYSGDMWANEIGYITHEFIVTGPGGTGNCSATLKIVANNDWNPNNTIELKSPVSFSATGKVPVMKACPASSCYGIYAVDFEINGSKKVLLSKKNEDWYYADYPDNSPVGQSTGWIPSNIVPAETRQKIESQNPLISASQSTNNNTGGGGTDKSTTNTPTTTQGSTSTDHDALVEFIYMIIGALLLFGFYRLTTRVLRKIPIMNADILKIMTSIKENLKIDTLAQVTVNKSTKTRGKKATRRLFWKRVTFALVGVAIATGSVYLGLQSWNSYKEQQEQERILLQKQIEQGEVDAQAQNKKLDELNKQVTDLKNKPPDVIYKTTVVQAPETSKERTVVEITKEWSPQVVYIDCTWYYTSGRFYKRAAGSGFLTTFLDGTIGIMTNKHVILDDGLYKPNFCDVYFLNGDKYTSYKSQSAFYYSKKYDIGQINISQLSDTTRGLTKRADYYCSNEPEIGDKVVILGYPGIGASQGITVTEGIISGLDGYYYVTSAKVDSGNSGGIAVSVKDNCIVGMPSATADGLYESLGRILSSKAMLE